MELTPGNYAYMPAKIIHDAWTKDEGRYFLHHGRWAVDVTFVK